MASNDKFEDEPKPLGGNFSNEHNEPSPKTWRMLNGLRRQKNIGVCQMLTYSKDYILNFTTMSLRKSFFAV